MAWRNNHVHLIVEAKDRHALARGMAGPSIRVSKGLNELWRQRGRVFADRFHDHVLRTPTEVRNAVRYLLANASRHGIRFVGGVDPFTSADPGRGPVARTANVVAPSGPESGACSGLGAGS